MEKGLLLLSGGIDSPVAGHIAAEQTPVAALHFSAVKFLGPQSEEKALKLAKKLNLKQLFLVDLSQGFKEIVKKCEHKYYFVLTKRLMFRVAEKIAQKQNFSFLISGENLGQVSSQTLSNLTTITRAVKIPIIRPLLSFDKMETVNLAQQINTLQISTGPETCDFLGPKHPATKSSHEEMLNEEKKLNYEKIINDAVKQMQIKKL